MIVFDLQCAAQNHVFEAWFGSTADYEAQRERGLVACPLCGDLDVVKAVMAPRVAAKGNQLPAATGGESQMMAAAPAETKEMLRASAEMQRQILAQSDYVGERFTDEARSIHLGEAPVRSIYGKATADQTRGLLEDGIAVAPLPLPVVAPGEEN
jgi:hypothetical protein